MKNFTTSYVDNEDCLILELFRFSSFIFCLWLPGCLCFLSLSFSHPRFELRSCVHFGRRSFRKNLSARQKSNRSYKPHYKWTSQKINSIPPNSSWELEWSFWIIGSCASFSLAAFFSLSSFSSFKKIILSYKL